MTGPQFKKWRLHHKLTPLQAANVVGVSVSTISRYEANVSVPDCVSRIAKAYPESTYLRSLAFAPELQNAPHA
jgi:transcriptional regulator with XRE-family HTH domain